MSAAKHVINSSDYIKLIFNEINYKWPELYNHLTINFKGSTYRSKRNYLCTTIGYTGVNTYDDIIKYIMKNEDKIDWWIL